MSHISQCLVTMIKFYFIGFVLSITIHTSVANSWDGYTNSNYENDCGPYGFTCERNNRVRICDETKSVGPVFKCPAGTFCNEESTDVCEDAINHIDPTLTKKLRCNRNERIANPNVPGCKGYILCVPNGSRFQGINFKCSGNTIFNGLTRTCTSPSKYKCPQGNATKSGPELYNSDRRKISINDKPSATGYNLAGHRPSSIECKNYKFTVTQDDSSTRATYFCPPRPVRGEDTVRCTIFSNYFCVTLERDDIDQFVPDGTPYRRPRKY